MSDPLGYNPIGQSAPGLPRHDAPLPGHVGGSYTPIGAGGDYGSSAPVYSSYGGGGVAVGSYGPPSGVALWLMRVFAFFATWMTLPLAMTLYPLAGLAGGAAGTAGYLVLGVVVLEPRERIMLTSLSVLLGFLLAAKFDIGLAEKFSLYRYLRFAARLAIVGAAVYFSQAGEPATALPAALTAVVITFFVLRSKTVRQTLHGFQTLLWLRKD